ncbi:CoA-binding protein [Candidatus Bipolaricaulota bacterium]|nr:CoA-binding protein [Candidatus Bipolaricaulota bacterium]
MEKKTNIEYLFKPRSVAVIGASQNRSKIGYRIVENIVSSGYKGKVYPINPKGGEILGCAVYPNLSEVKGEVDVAVIAIPARFVFDSLKGCAAKGVKYLVIITRVRAWMPRPLGGEEKPDRP